MKSYSPVETPSEAELINLLEAILRSAYLTERHLQILSHLSYGIHAKYGTKRSKIEHAQTYLTLKTANLALSAERDGWEKNAQLYARERDQQIAINRTAAVVLDKTLGQRNELVASLEIIRDELVGFVAEKSRPSLAECCELAEQARASIAKAI